MTPRQSWLYKYDRVFFCRKTMHMLPSLFFLLAIQAEYFHSAIAARCSDEFLRQHFPNDLKGKNITVATITNYPPFVKRVGHDVPCGFDIDLMNLIGSIYRIQFNYQYVDVVDLISTVQNHTRTISITHQAITEDRMKSVNFVQFFRAGVVFIAKSSYSNSINQLTDVCGKKVAVINATLQKLVLEKTQNSCAQNPIKIVSVISFPYLLQLVSNGTAELGFQDEPVLQRAVIESNGQLKILGNTYYVTPRGILCNKHNQPLCCILINAMNYLINAGLYEQLLERYSFSYRKNGICPSRLNLEGTTCRAQCVPSPSMCEKKLDQ